MQVAQNFVVALAVIAAVAFLARRYHGSPGDDPTGRAVCGSCPYRYRCGEFSSSCLSRGSGEKGNSRAEDPQRET